MAEGFSLFAKRTLCRHDPSLCDGTFRGQRISLRGLELEGELPTQLGLLRQLTHIDLSVNKLDARSLPTELGKLDRLVEMRLDNNNIRGTIPTEFGKLRQLESLILFQNYISGSLPTQDRQANLRTLSAKHAAGSHVGLGSLIPART